MAWASLRFSVELLPKLLSCFLPPFCLCVLPTAEQAMLVAGLSPRNPSCSFCPEAVTATRLLAECSRQATSNLPLAKSDGYHFAWSIAGAHTGGASMAPVGDDQLLTRWREGESARHFWHFWFERGAPAVVPGTASTFSHCVGGTRIAPLGTDGETHLNFSNSGEEGENICVYVLQHSVWLPSDFFFLFPMISAQLTLQE